MGGRVDAQPGRICGRDPACGEVLFRADAAQGVSGRGAHVAAVRRLAAPSGDRCGREGQRQVLGEALRIRRLEPARIEGNADAVSRCVATRRARARIAEIARRLSPQSHSEPGAIAKSNRQSGSEERRRRERT